MNREEAEEAFMEDAEDLRRMNEEEEEEEEGRRTGCIQNENPHIGEWWEKCLLSLRSQ